MPKKTKLKDIAYNNPYNVDPKSFFLDDVLEHIKEQRKEEKKAKKQKLYN